MEYCCEAEKTGADFARLSSSELTFETSSVKVDKQADDYISKFFPKLISIEYDDAVVCLGEMTLFDAKFVSVSPKEEAGNLKEAINK